MTVRTARSLPAGRASRASCIAGALLCVLAPVVASAQLRPPSTVRPDPVVRTDDDNGYRQPPDAIRRILDAPPTPLVGVSPDRAWLLVLERAALPSIAEVSAPELGLAGARVNPRTGGPSRGTSFTALGLLRTGAAATTVRRIATPADAIIGNPSWSPDARRVSFTVQRDSGITLWLADAATGEARALVPDRNLNATMGAPCAWMPASDGMLCRFVPDGRGAQPPAPGVPSGPIVQESEGRSAANRTYQDLLGSAHDEALFDHYFTSQLAIVALDGRVTPVGAPGIHAGAMPSPDGRYLLVERIHRPYSYVVPLGRFPRASEIWDRTSGARVATIGDRPLLDQQPTSFDAVAPGPRSVQWRSDAPATLVWAEAMDGGDPAVAAPKRDRVRMQAAPFMAEPQTLAQLEYRFSDIEWARPDLALVSESWRKTRRTRTWAVDPTMTGVVAPKAPRVLFDRSSEDRYADPGSFVTTVGATGRTVVMLAKDQRSAFLTGAGASAEGDRPFLDRIDLMTGAKTRLWRSAAPYYEEVITLLDTEGARAITRRESVKDVPNYFQRDVKRGRLTQLTRFADPAPEFAGVTAQLITYPRADGVQLSGTMYLPAGHTAAQGRLPFVFWAYPQEFATAAAAAQVRGSPFRFVRPTGASHLFLLTQGYGVLDGPSMPIVGADGAEPNDSYVEQLVASAQAAVDKVVALGVADRERIGVGGHSYGAFMTANLLAHSKLFQAGIARSGAYNRTLTPFGFQAEERPFWQAQEIYTRMSPFTYANRIKTPILLIHGMADDNSGTFPVQTERFFAALQGNGATVRYVQLPAEAHGYRARESVGHTLWEMTAWLDRYVKGVGRPRASVR